MKKGKIPLPSSVSKKLSAAMVPKTKPKEIGPRHCTDKSHKTTSDCRLAAAAHSEPTNGDQYCSLVATKNGILIFRAIMGSDRAKLGDPIPAAHESAMELWSKFERLINGCADHLVDNMSNEDLDELLGVIVDFADMPRASAALAVRMAHTAKLNEAESPELANQVRRGIRFDMPLQYVWNKLAR